MLQESLDKFEEGLELGSGRGDLQVPDSVLEELRIVHHDLAGAR